MPEPNVQPSESLQTDNPNNPEVTIIPNDPAALVAQALNNSKHAARPPTSGDPAADQDSSTRLWRKASAKAQSLGPPYRHG